MQYLVENSLVVITFMAIVIPALVLALLYLFEIFRNADRAQKTAIYGFLGFIFMFAGYLTWIIRASILPAAAPIAQYFVYFALAYTFVALGGVFMTVWVLSLMRPAFLESRKWLLAVLFLIIWVAMVAVTWLAPTFDGAWEMVIQGTNDVKTGGYLQMTYLLMFIPFVLMWYALIMNYRVETSSKILLLFVAILIYCVGLFLEGLKMFALEPWTTAVRGVLALGLWLMLIWALTSKRV